MSLKYSLAASVLFASQAIADVRDSDHIHGSFPDEDTANNGVIEAGDYGVRDPLAQAVLENYLADRTLLPVSFHKFSERHNHDVNETCVDLLILQSPLLEAFNVSEDDFYKGVACLPFEMMKQLHEPSSE